jgi:hypothetical protein
MMMNGQSMPMPAPTIPPSTMVMSPTGKVVSMNVPGMAAMTSGGQNMLSSMQSSSAMPLQPIKPGDTWQQSATVPGVGATIQTPMSLVGITQSGGDSVARISIVMNGTIKGNLGQTAGMAGVMDTGTITGSGIDLFDVDQGMMTTVDMTMHMDMATTMPMPQSAAGAGPPMVVHSLMDMHMVMTLVPGGAN